MKRVAILAAAVLCAAAPASIGLIGNASFSEDVPVRVPERAVVLDVHGATPAAARTRTAEPGDDRPDGRTDDKGGRRRHDVERSAGTPVATPTVRATDDHGGGRRGADDPATHDAGDDSGHRSGRSDGSHSGGSDDRSGSSGSGSSSGGSGRSGHDD